MSWLDGQLVALDTETTGTDPEAARIVQITVGTSVHPGHWHPTSLIINPGIPIPAESTAVHGFTDGRVQSDGLPPGDVLIEIAEILYCTAADEVPVVAHNAAYDLTVIDRELRRHLGVRLPGGLIVLDTLCLFRRFDWRTGGRSLGALAARHGVTFPAHDAEEDAYAALQLLRILGEINDVLPLIEPVRLHDAQVGWWADQQAQAKAKALGNGSPFASQPRWPLIPFTGEGVLL